MTNVRCWCAALAGAIGATGVAGTGVQAQSYAIRVNNPLAIARPDETVALAWSDVTRRLPAAAAGQVRVRDLTSGQEVASQVVDNDGNGTLDELIFQTSLAPNDIKRFAIERGAPTKPARARVYVSHQMPRDDIAWESDRIAFRIYGQGLWTQENLHSSGVDVWVKRTRDTIIERFYSKGHDSYHRDTGEGADFFDVGETLGAGGTAIWRDTTMYRAENFKSYKILTNGPVRAIFELYYEPWNAGPGMRVTETKRVALDAGSNLNHVTSIFTVQGAGPRDFKWVTGLVKRAAVVGSMSKTYPWAWMTHWGPVLPKDGGHGDFGIAVMLPRPMVDEWRENATHYFVVSHATSGQPVDYYVGAGWTDSGDYRDVRDWWNYLDAFAQRLSTPVQVTVEAPAP